MVYTVVGDHIKYLCVYDSISFVNVNETSSHIGIVAVKCDDSIFDMCCFTYRGYFAFRERETEGRMRFDLLRLSQTALAFVSVN